MSAGRQIGIVIATVGLVWVVSPAWVTLRSEQAYSQTVAAPEGGLQVVSALLPTGVQQLSVLDSRAKSLAVYHIDPTTGKIQLKSARNLVWDLQMEHFNGQTPLPSEIRQVQP